MNKLLLSSAIATCLTVSGCSNTADVQHNAKPVSSIQALESALQTTGVAKVLATEPKQLWAQGFEHHQTGLLGQVADGIYQLASLKNLSQTQYQQLEQLSFYLRVYSSFGPDKDWPEGDAEKLHTALMTLSGRDDFYTLSSQQVRLHENYVVALYRFYYMEPLQGYFGDHVKPLTQLVDLYADQPLENDLAYDYALWEVVRSVGILAHEVRGRNKEVFTDSVAKDDELANALLRFLQSKNAIRNGKTWPRENALWGLAKWYGIRNKQYFNAYYAADEETQAKLDDDKLTWPIQDKMKALDEKVWQALEHLSAEQRTEAFTVPYLVNTFRGKTECDEQPLKGRCTIPTLEEALPQRTDCSDSLFILSQSMTTEQLDKSCQRLTTQTATFHEKLATKQQPVANDFNEKLRVVIFDDQGQYNIYGSLIFDINTENGGMYIEGTPQNPDNQATFFAYEQFWARPEFKVWNLNHEYVHYLDGRFVKYDTFGHFPSHLVWWSEGLAEYIAEGDDNSRAAKLLHDKDKSEWLSLKEVFDTEYKDGGDRVYRWGYMATRFMNEQAPETYRKMAHYLKTDYFDGYKGLLEQAGEQLQDKFATWLDEFHQAHQAAEEAKDPTKPRQFYRYSYRRYLKPAYLVEDARHMHWQYWHANALKAKGGVEVSK